MHDIKLQKCDDRAINHKNPFHKDSGYYVQQSMKLGRKSQCELLLSDLFLGSCALDAIVLVILCPRLQDKSNVRLFDL